MYKCVQACTSMYKSVQECTRAHKIVQLWMSVYKFVSNPIREPCPPSLCWILKHLTPCIHENPSGWYLSWNPQSFLWCICNSKKVICNFKKMLQFKKAVLPLILSLCNSTEFFYADELFHKSLFSKLKNSPNSAWNLFGNFDLMISW